jgi:hypothetical protein
MYLKFYLFSLVLFALFLQRFCIISTSPDDCKKRTFGKDYACGAGCTGTPPCGKNKCGNVDDMCYCDCSSISLVDAKCVTSELGYKWNGGVKLANGSYALNGTKGDGKAYKC